MDEKNKNEGFCLFRSNDFIKHITVLTNEELNYLYWTQDISFVCLFVFCLIDCFWRDSPHWVRASSLTRFLDHTQRRTTVSRTPLDE